MIAFCWFAAAEFGNHLAIRRRPDAHPLDEIIAEFFFFFGRNETEQSLQLVEIADDNVRADGKRQKQARSLAIFRQNSRFPAQEPQRVSSDGMACRSEEHPSWWSDRDRSRPNFPSAWHQPNRRSQSFPFSDLKAECFRFFEFQFAHIENKFVRQGMDGTFEAGRPA